MSYSSLILWGRVIQSTAPHMLLTFSVLREEGGFYTGLPWSLVPWLTLMCFLIHIYSSGMCDGRKGRFP